jgi:hypothetical protein
MEPVDPSKERIFFLLSPSKARFVISRSELAESVGAACGARLMEREHLENECVENPCALNNNNPEIAKYKISAFLKIRYIFLVLN